jgi:hypothetical protein
MGCGCGVPAVHKLEQCDAIQPASAHAKPSVSCGSGRQHKRTGECRAYLQWGSNCGAQARLARVQQGCQGSIARCRQRNKACCAYLGQEAAEACSNSCSSSAAGNGRCSCLPQRVQRDHAAGPAAAALAAVPSAGGCRLAAAVLATCVPSPTLHCCRLLPSPCHSHWWLHTCPPWPPLGRHQPARVGDSRVCSKHVCSGCRAGKEQRCRTLGHVDVHDGVDTCWFHYT